MLHRKLGSLILVLALLGLSFGCTGVEKRSEVKERAVMGGGVGSIIGAGAGHATAAGAWPGALAGLSIGAATGALTTSRYYDDPETATLDQEELRQLQEALAAKDMQVSELEEKMQQSEAQRRALLEAHQKMQQKQGDLQDAFGDDIQLTAHGDGYKATILGDVLFDSGRASLTSEGRSVLARAARQIRESFPNAYIEVRGHTDNVPITHSDWKSNWELSAARANNVLHYLIDEHGFSQSRIRAAYFSDTQPVASNDTAEGRRKNRRAEIVIMPEGSRGATAMENN